MTNDLEDKLRLKLKRISTPTGLEQKILARVDADRIKTTKQKLNPWFAIASGLILTLSIPSYLVNRHYRAEKAKAQLLFALQLTSEKLNSAFALALQETQERVKHALEEKKS